MPHNHFVRRRKLGFIRNMTSTVPIAPGTKAVPASQPVHVVDPDPVESRAAGGTVVVGLDAFVLLCLYCLETAVIGFWTILAAGDDVARSGIGSGTQYRRHACAVGIFHGARRPVHDRAHAVHLHAVRGPWAGKIHDARDFIRLIVIGMGLWIPLLALFAGQGAIFINDAVNRFVFAKTALTNARYRRGSWAVSTSVS